MKTCTVKSVRFVRHGEVEEAFQHRYNGWNDITLSPKGFEQIRSVAKQISHSPLLYCSDIRRCKETASFFKAEKTVFSELIREKSWGKHEGMSFEEIEASGIAYHTFDQFIRELDGETPEQFSERVLHFWSEVKDTIPHNTTILTHGGVIYTILARENEISLEESYCRFKVPYGSITTIELHSPETR